VKGDRDKCPAAGMDGYVAKPLSVRALVEAIDSAMGSEVPGRRPPVGLEAMVERFDGEGLLTESQRSSWKIFRRAWRH
jgi:DNA-binding NarL/FixJ family response regulator